MMETCAPVSVLSTRVVYIDHHNAAPTECDLPVPFGPGNDRFVKTSPSIRVFGTAPNGKKHAFMCIRYLFSRYLMPVYNMK